jgi:hypothetical protein
LPRLGAAHNSTEEADHGRSATGTAGTVIVTATTGSGNTRNCCPVQVVDLLNSGRILAGPVACTWNRNLVAVLTLQGFVIYNGEKCEKPAQLSRAFEDTMGLELAQNGWQGLQVVGNNGQFQSLGTFREQFCADSANPCEAHR